MLKKIEKKIEVYVNLDDLANELDGCLFDYISDNIIEFDAYKDIIQQISYEDWCYILDKIKDSYD